MSKVEYPFVMNSIEEPKSIYIFLLLIFDKYETIIFAAGPAEIKILNYFSLLVWIIFETKKY